MWIFVCNQGDEKYSEFIPSEYLYPTKEVAERELAKELDKHYKDEWELRNGQYVFNNSIMHAYSAGYVYELKIYKEK